VKSTWYGVKSRDISATSFLSAAMFSGDIAAKDSVKDAVKFITSFEDQLVYQAKKRNCKGVICGHIHKPENKIIDGTRYLNTGDWIENNSYIVYDKGRFDNRNSL